MYSETTSEDKPSVPQCQFFVVRKKRLCRMTVRPGKQYCGEHEPQPKTENGGVDKRIPCPNDPKHTCYESKLEKHLTVCNARQHELPPYIVTDINSCLEPSAPRIPLSGILKENLNQLIDKVNFLYDKHVEGNISSVPERPIHHTVLEEFSEANRGESSLRHLRQASSLLWIMETEGLVQDKTCYVELGAGKGQLSYYACRAWCETGGEAGAAGGEAGAGVGTAGGEAGARGVVLLVDRATLRHKRDSRLAAAARVRADLRHLALQHVPGVRDNKHVVGFAKHLCGVATDYALRCVCAASLSGRTRGLVLATCCHHRCERAAYLANQHLQELGINEQEMNIMLGVVSWATCGDGRSRDYKNKQEPDENTIHKDSSDNQDSTEQLQQDNCSEEINESGSKDHQLSQEFREKIGRKAKALLDWGRVLWLRDKGFDARLCYYVPTSVSLENVCIIAKKLEAS